MEEGVAQVKFSGMGEVGAGKESDEDEGEATRAMVVSQNRKGKKSGGFQSMGKPTRSRPDRPVSWTMICST